MIIHGPNNEIKAWEKPISFEIKPHEKPKIYVPHIFFLIKPNLKPRSYPSNFYFFFPSFPQNAAFRATTQGLTKCARARKPKATIATEQPPNPPPLLRPFPPESDSYCSPVLQSLSSLSQMADPYWRYGEVRQPPPIPSLSAKRPRSDYGNLHSISCIHFSFWFHGEFRVSSYFCLMFYHAFFVFMVKLGFCVNCFAFFFFFVFHSEIRASS